MVRGPPGLVCDPPGMMLGSPGIGCNLHDMVHDPTGVLNVPLDMGRV